MTIIPLRAPMKQSTNSRFQIYRHPFGTHLRYELIDTATGESVSILPFQGGTITSLRVQSGTDLIETIDGYVSFEDVQKSLESSFKGSNLFPFPNRVAGGSYMFRGEKYQLPVNFPHENNAIHGLVYNKPFTVTQPSEGGTRCSIVLSFDSDCQEEGYPFSFNLSHEYSFDLHEGFCCTTRIRNNSDRDMPAGHGWHPYFTAGAETIDQLMLSFPAREMLEVDTANIPTGPTVAYNDFASPVPVAGKNLDSCFLLEDASKRANILLVNTKLNLKLRLWQEMGQGKYNYLQVYTPPHRNSIAIEPMTCAPDALNNGNGLLTIAPNKTATVSWGIVIEK